MKRLTIPIPTIICLFTFTFCLFSVSTTAQDYFQAFEEGQQFFEEEQYYEAYLRFNAAEVLSRNAGKPQFAQKSREWLDKSAYGVQRQQVITDSLLKATKKLTDAFYFWDGRLALAYKIVLGRGMYGFINKQGEIEIDFNYESATNFDAATGYAKVVESGQSYWLAPDGKEYPGDQEVNSLPKVERLSAKRQEGEKGERGENKEVEVRTLDNYFSNGTKDYQLALNEGIQLFNDQQYYDAYLRFNAVNVLAGNAGDKRMAQTGKQLKDTAIYEIRSLFSQAKEALSTARKIRNAFYFYDNKFALAFQNGSFYFIDQDGNEYPKLGRWTRAEPFDEKGLAKVENERRQFLLDTAGQAFHVAFFLSDLRKDITALDLRGTWLDRFPSEVLDHPQLEILIIDGKRNQENSCVISPPDLQALQQLKVLSLAFCNLTNLPSEIVQLRNLRSLDLSYNQLSGLPIELGYLQNLNSLDLGSNQLSELPDEIANLQNLRSLDLRNNQLRELPPEIVQLQNLRSLDLGYIQLSILPPEIVQLQNLRFLNLSDNYLSKLPAEIGQLQNLSSLYLGWNQLNGLPTEIIQLQNLRSLDLIRNQLSELPPEIVHLKNLHELYLWNNQLNVLPIEIVQLQNLTTLDLSENHLSELPVEIVQLQNLNSLDLGSNQLSELPAEIAQLQNLNSLNLGYNQLSTLPAGIMQLQNLKFLNLTDNQLSELPPEIVQLKNLSELFLSGNQLSELPPEIVQLQNLSTLYLGSIQLSELPAEIIQLKNLSELDLNDNQLSALPSEIGQLQNLITLDLDDNNLSSLPPEIGQLQNLRTLSLNSNRLDSLPPEIGKLHNLKFLSIEDNPLKNLPEQIWELDNLVPRVFIGLALSQKNYLVVFRFYKKQVSENPDNYLKWYDLSKYAIFAEKPQEAIQAAQKTLELNPGALSVETKLALGYLFSNQWIEAEEIYKKWKDKFFPNNNRFADTLFLQDLMDLEEAGITHPDFEKVRALFEN